MSWGSEPGGAGSSGPAPGGPPRDSSAGDPAGGPAPGGGAPAFLIRLYDPIEAEIILAKLRSAGIDAFNFHESLSVVYGLTVDGCGQQDIFVRAEDLEVARVALEPDL